MGSPDTPVPGTAPPTVGLWVHRLGGLDARTGVGRYALELACALSDLAADDPDLPRYELVSARERAALPPRLAAGPPVRRAWVPPRLLHLAWMAARWPRYEQVGPRPDLLHVLFPSFPIASAAPRVTTIHDLFTLDHPDWYPAGERRAVARSVQVAAAESERIVCDSAAVARQVQDRLGVEYDRIVIAHPGVSDAWRVERWDLDQRRRSRDGRQPYVVAVGAVHPRKNLGLLVRALARLPGVDLVIAGPPGAASAPLSRLVEELGLRGRVHVTGALPDEALVDVVRGAEALVHPSLDEGFGFPPVEAMAAGTPALAADAASLPEIVEDGGLVLEPSDPDVWAAAIERVVTDAEHRAQLVLRGLERADRFTWARAAAEVARCHLDVLSRSSERAG